MDNLSYLQMLLSNSGVVITGQEQADWSKLEKNEINKLVFERIATTGPRTIAPELEEKLKAIDDTLFKRVLVARDNNIHNILQRVDSMVYDARLAQSRFEEKLLNLAKLRVELAASASNCEAKKMTDIVNECIKNPFYTLINIDGEELTFLTNPVTIRYYHEVQGIDIAVPMGSFKVVIKPLLNRVRVHLGENNTSVNGCIHPHVGISGDVCWGNGADRAINALRNLELHTVLQILEIILKTYNPDSPYVTLQLFKFHQDKPDLSNEHHVYRSQGIAWILEEKFNELDFEGVVYDLSTGEDDDGEERDMVQAKVYRRYYPKYDYYSPSYYLKGTDGEYHLIDEEIIYEL